MNITINDELKLTEIRPDDKTALVTHLNDESIYRNTMTIPFPYKDSDAEDWISHNRQLSQNHGNHLNLAIRIGEELVGVVGLLAVGPPDPHRSEVGYWLAKSQRNRGVATNALAKFVRYAFETFNLSKLTALVFSGNTASERVLVKCGFEQEGVLRSHALKGETLIDLVAFGLLRTDYLRSTDE